MNIYLFSLLFNFKYIYKKRIINIFIKSIINKNSSIMNTLNNMTNPYNMPAMPYGGILDPDGCRMLARKIFSTYDSIKKENYI